MIKRFFRPLLFAALQMMLVFAGLVWLLDSGAEAMGYTWQWHRVPEYVLIFEDGEWWQVIYCTACWSHCSSLGSV